MDRKMNSPLIVVNARLVRISLGRVPDVPGLRLYSRVEWCDTESTSPLNYFSTAPAELLERR